ncbi:MAG: type I methionyl aminopeptidase [Candidatus Omnitrophica bacterium]|nr:type I methionyl aminopeptidase [Candidatus Omnitrophota bacterium]
MIALRGAEEIGRIRSAGRIIGATFGLLKRHIKPGVRTRELDRLAREEILRLGGYPAFKGYKGYPANICVSINEAVVHGIPSERKLREGEIVSIDIGVKYRDYFADAAMTFAVGEISEPARRLMQVTKKSLEMGIENAVAGKRLSDISSAIQKHVESNGFSVVRSFVGHGIGTGIHEDPEVPNYGKPGMGPRLEPGMVLAIEPMVNAGTHEVEILDDGWTAVTADRKFSAHFEHTIAIRDGAAEILTV